MKSPKPINVSSIVVKRGRIVCEIEVPDERCRYTNMQIAQWALGRYPALSHHACVNAEGKTFGCVIDCTALPHLLEHIAIELQTRASEDFQATFVGTSEWLDEAKGKACVQLSFNDDLEALRAFREAVDVINENLTGEPV